MSAKSNCIAILCAVLMPLAASGQRDVPIQSGDCRFITAADLFDPKAPVFEAYPSAGREHILNPKLDPISNPIAKRYRTVLRLEIALGSNYYEHYRDAILRCLASFAMI